MTASSVSEALRVLASFGLLTAPGIAILRVRYRELPWLEVGGLGACVALAANVVALALLGRWDLGYQRWAVAALYAAAIAVAIRARSSPATTPAPGLPTHLTTSFLVLIAVQLAVVASPLLFSPLPHGEDPVYHVAVVQKLVETRQLPKDFLPWDPVAPTYTLGSHWLCAFIESLSGVPSHRLYQLSMIFFLLLSTALVFGIGRALYGDRIGLLAAGCYALVVNWGSLDLIRWGSLPNLVGVAFLLASVRLALLEPRAESTLLLGLCAGAMMATHHLSALIFGCLLVGLGIAGAMRGGALRDRFRRLVRGYLLGVVVVLPSVLALSSEVLERLFSSEASALGPGLPYLNVKEPALGPLDILANLGPIACLLALLGGLASRRRPGDSNRFLLAWILSLAVPYALLDWVLRFAVQSAWGIDRAILTPSRFLTDLAYPLAIAAALGLGWLLERYPRVFWPALVVGIAYAVWTVSPLWKPAVEAEVLSGLAWFGENSPEDSLLLGNPHWTAYVSGREGAQMVLRQERLSPYTRRKRGLASGGFRAVDSWMREYGRPVYLWEVRTLDHRRLRLVWKQGRHRIYRFVTPAAPRR